MRAALTLLRRDFLLARRAGSASALGLAVFLLVITLFPLAIGPDTALLARVGPGIVWVAVLLAVLLPLERLFAADGEDGSLDQLLLSPLGALGTALMRCLSHWLIHVAPLLLLAPVLAVAFGLVQDGVALFVALLLGSPVLVLIGGVGAALLVGARRGGALLALLVLPLQMPVLVFGVSTAAGDSGTAPLLFLGAMDLLALALAPLAMAAGLKMAVE